MINQLLEEYRKTFVDFENSFTILDNLARYVEHKSKFINITSIRDYESIWYKHIFDSLIISQIETINDQIKTGCDILDVGTGGGFPGLPLAIAYPNSNFWLLDSTNKKLKIIDQFIENEKIQNAKTLWARAEDVPLVLRNHQGALFDIVLVRSVGAIEKVIDLGFSLLKTGGKLVLYKSVKEPALANLFTIAQSRHFQIRTKHPYEILGDKRIILILEKF